MASWTKGLGAALLAALAGTSCAPPVNQATTVPAATCVLSEADFASWKAAGGAGFAAPSSAGFAASGNCSFFKWSSQMFLWLTSTDASGNLNLFSSTFYNAVESPSTGGFRLTRNLRSSGNSTKASAVFEVRVNKPRLLLRKPASAHDPDATGQAGGGVLIVNGAPVPVAGKSGYATYPVVYYAIQVNDIFAALQKNQATIPYYKNGPGQGQFPTSQPQGQQIQAAAGATYPDLDQLALEVKSAWVDTAYLAPDQARGLLTITADVPAFTQSTNDKGQLVLSWDGATMATRTLALTGMHVVGSVAGHPEMIWSTFETRFNSPDATYSYLNANYDPAAGTCRPGTTCLTNVPFSASSREPSIFYTGQPGAPAPALPIVQTAASGNNNSMITSTGPALTPTNVARLNPWGSQQPATPSVGDPAVLNNTMLISLKRSLEGHLSTGGGRGAALANYFLVGAVWSNGTIPNSPGAKQSGSPFAANTTMETFQQVNPDNPDPNATAANCFSCHNVGTGAKPGTSVSHVFPNVSN